MIIVAFNWECTYNYFIVRVFDWVRLIWPRVLKRGFGKDDTEQKMSKLYISPNRERVSLCLTVYKAM